MEDSVASSLASIRDSMSDMKTQIADINGRIQQNAQKNDMRYDASQQAVTALIQQVADVQTRIEDRIAEEKEQAKSNYIKTEKNIREISMRMDDIEKAQLRVWKDVVVKLWWIIIPMIIPNLMPLIHAAAFGAPKQ